MCMTSPVLLYDNSCTLLLRYIIAHQASSPVLLDCNCSLQPSIIVSLQALTCNKKCLDKIA